MAEERLLGMTPALHMDAKDERVQCQLEINFIDCVVTPLWEHCAHCFPALQPCMERVRANRAAYAALASCSNEEVAQVRLVVSSADMMHNVVFYAKFWEFLHSMELYCASVLTELANLTEKGQQSSHCCSSRQ